MKFNLKAFSPRSLVLGTLAAAALVAAPLALVQPVTAQDGGRHGGRGHRFEQLNLTDAQSAQIESIRTNTRAQMEALLTAEQRATLGEGESGRRGWKALDLTDEQREQMRSLKESSREQINAVLTDEQREQLPQRGEGRGRGSRRAQ